MKLRRALFLIGSMLTCGIAAQALAESVLVLKAGKVFPGDGNTIENGMVLVKDGKIGAIGVDFPIPEGARVIDLPAGCITPGLIDANSTAGILSSHSRSWAEHGSELIPHLKTIDSVDLDNEAFRRLARKGVTTVYLGADPSSVIGSRGAIVKTGGNDRIVNDAFAITATFGSEPFRRGLPNRTPRGNQQTFLTRRPTTRMGVGWVFREAFYSASRYGRTPGSEPDPAMDALLEVIEGKTPLRIQARLQHDIRTAIRLTREFDIDHFVLEQGTEAAKCIDLLEELEIPVIYGPLFETPLGLYGQGREAAYPNLSTPRLLHEAGVEFALSAGELTGENALPHQATFAMRNGLTLSGALRATTSTPGKLLGVEDRIGSLAPGKDADLVLWNGEPFAATTGPEVVLIDGEIVHSKKPVDSN